MCCKKTKAVLDQFPDELKPHMLALIEGSCLVRRDHAAYDSVMKSWEKSEGKCCPCFPFIAFGAALSSAWNAFTANACRFMRTFKNVHHPDFLSNAQHPYAAYSGCTDSRTSELVANRAGLGEALVVRTVGACLADKDNKVMPDSQRFLDLAKSKGIEVVYHSHHGDCGAMNVIYSYHKVQGAKDGMSPAFRQLSEDRKYLVDEVEKNGLGYYENLGVTLVGDEGARFRQAMAIQQGILDYKAVLSDPSNPKMLLIFHNVPELFSYVYSINTGKFVKLPNRHGPSIFRAVKDLTANKCSEHCCCHSH